MNPKNRWLTIIGLALGAILLLVGLQYWMASFVNQLTASALSPVTEANQQIKTEVARVLHPTPTVIPDPVTIIHEVRSLARLETIQYTVEKVITAEIGQGEFGFLFGDKLLFVAHGTVIAGVDLNRLTSDHLELKGPALYVTLPEPEVFVAELDNDKSYVYDRQTGILSKGQKDLETRARQVAEQEILKAAVEDGILKQARLNAENYLSRLFRKLGYSEVIFLIPTPEP